jgi:tetratricopeptide (TPR) repeat protein
VRHSSSSAADLLSLMSFFDRHGIPEALLYNRNLDDDISSEDYSDSDSDASAYDQGITMSADMPDDSADTLDDDLFVLRSYSFITVTADTSVFEMHRLVQLATQDWLKCNGSFERWGGQLVTNFDEAFPLGIFENREVCQPLFPHVHAAKKIKLHDRDAVLRQASILSKGAGYAQEIGAFHDCVEMNEQAFQSMNELLGPEHSVTIKCMLGLGVAYIYTTQRKEALSVLIEALERAKRSVGEDNTLTLECMHILGRAYTETGMHVDAERIQAGLHLKCRQKYGEEDQRTQSVISGLAITLSEKGQHTEAEDLALGALAIARKLYPAGHQEMIHAQHLLSSIYYNAARYEEARQPFSEVFLRRSELLGCDHPETLMSMEWLSSSMYKLGQRRSAIDLLRDCADKSARKLGPHHIATARRDEKLREWEVENEDENGT